jgi:oxygen-independent coproporphyrinogen-3 oxidase
MERINSGLIRKYNLPLPRYTSYPTVPFWNEQLDLLDWPARFKTKFEEENHKEGISIYIHLPFCESLCTYCGCNKKITTNHGVEDEYILAIEKEWDLYRKLMNQTPVIREIHLGGGTPTFFSPRNLERLLNIILKRSIIHPQREFSIEAHPNNTTLTHLKVLHGLGFRRISFGVQDNDPKVQQIINRIQPFENVEAAITNARAVGFTSVNFDLIYGLPLQTEESIERTIKEVIGLKPDRIAFYSYAHVPWTSKAQRLFDESHLPSAEEKLKLYIKGKELFLDAGYADIGMDHFALPTDDLYKAWRDGQLHRSFMGYTTQRSGLLLGLGVSSISDIGGAFAQNAKTLHDYYEMINKGKLAIKKGYVLSESDLACRKYILDVACRGETSFRVEDLEDLEHYSFPKLRELEKDGLVSWSKTGMNITDQGHYFIRNICSAFDHYLGKVSTQQQVFSKAV